MTKMVRKAYPRVLWKPSHHPGVKQVKVAIQDLNIDPKTSTIQKGYDSRRAYRLYPPPFLCVVGPFRGVAVQCLPQHLFPYG